MSKRNPRDVAARLSQQIGVGITHNGVAYIVEHSTQTYSTARGAARRARMVFKQQSVTVPEHRGHV